MGMRRNRKTALKWVLGGLVRNYHFYGFFFYWGLIDLLIIKFSRRDEYFSLPKFFINNLTQHKMTKKFYKLLGLFMSLFLGSTFCSLAQDLTLKGKVVEEDSQSELPGVAVILQGTGSGTVTGINGEFELSIPSGENVLTFSLLGYIKQEVSVNSNGFLEIVMEPDIKSMEEVVVVGFGTQKKVNLTGAVDVVNSERLENRPIANVGEGLQGVIPNLNVTVTNGDPTQSPQFNIRGFESINGGSPLILVDNVPMDINRINPDDIKSVTVLKDGAASAIYGARAAFGVILIETKRGKKGIDVRIGTQLSWNQPIFKVDPIDNGYEYAELRNQLSAKDGQSPYYNLEYMDRLKVYWDDPDNNSPYAVVDGQFENYGYNDMANSLMASTSPRQKYDLSISGASDKANYYTSVGIFNNDGYINHAGNDNFKRYNVLLKGDFKVLDWLTIDQQVTTNMQKSDKSSAANINDVIRTEPIRPFEVPFIEGYEQYEGMYWDNPFLILPQLENGGRRKESNSDVWLKTGLTINPSKRWTLTSSFSYNFFNRTIENARPHYETLSLDLSQNNPVLIEGEDKITTESAYNQYYVWNSFVEYLYDEGTDHYFKGMMGYNQEWDYNMSLIGRSSTFISPSIIDISATSGLQEVGGGKTQAALRGAFYRLNYIYKEKYLFETNGRYDGTSRFPEEDRYGFFPSFSVGWRLINEPWMNFAQEVMDNFKVRASYGSLGNQMLGNNFYPYIPSMNSGFTRYVMSSGPTPFINMPGIVSPSLTWEKVVTKNFGVDLGFFSGKLTSSFDIYTRETKEMLMRKEYPDILGTSAPQENAADLKTTGWEVRVQWRDHLPSGFSYNIDFNLSDWTSEITKYENPTGALNEYYIGQQIGEIWGYETVGIIQDEEQLTNLPDQTRLGDNWQVGDIEFRDVNGDGIISQGNNTLEDSGDRSIIGNNTPRYSFGLNTGLNYKNFSLSLFFQGVGKRDYYPSTGNWTWFFPWRSYNGDKSWIEDSWTEGNRDAYFPEMQFSNKNFTPQTRFLQNASYVRLKNINISYSLPMTLLSRVGLKGASIYVGAQNIWEYSTIRKPLDPEYIFDNSIDYPLFRSYTVGLNINL